jgi:DNA polymerase III subunit epsilon
MRQIFLDTETTGLSAHQGDRIVEIGCIEMINRQLTGQTWHFYLNPERFMSEGAVQIHGLTEEFLADKPLFSTVAEDFLQFVQGAELIIHNAAFDVGFLNEELRRVNRREIKQHVAQITDTLLMAREIFPGKSNSLDALCKRLEVDNSNRTYHGALLDAGLLADVYVRLTRGQKSLIMDESESAASDFKNTLEDTQLVNQDLGAYSLVSSPATADEMQAHLQIITDIDKTTGGKVLWKRA